MFERADRILDAAGELLLKHGYRRVTVEDIATRADVGKGTIYLHWRTKLELFEALMLRESIEVVEEFTAALRRDPAQVQPHRFARMSFLAMSRKPLLQAMIATDPELLGKLAKHPMRSHDVLAAERFFEVAERFALFRPDVPNVRYALSAAQGGFYLYPALETELDVEARADALAFTVRHAFEPAEEPTAEVLAAAATEFISIFQELIPPYRKWIYD
ncbi:TetR/AcrR family transcriptional regulator [Nonomuraea sp. K274]|uniref:TetR/AcrR family transcriptional regulator n=1 Tax=Nonomuraea cypriaca TaxID=1187855 RepID=A0A931A3Z2_9ACTN|nr:TetR/AcrR family transcriptional regulator [Nonomuraea cypriaca]MBF8185761.1 TetR/AcrR family transcriptional regulator [Nonomuraea cypriaca]